MPNNNPPNADTGNSANFVSPNGTCATGDCFFSLTGAGAYTTSDSPYGTFDQGGNVIEWNETLAEPFRRGIRGGGWQFVSDILRPVYGGGILSTAEDRVIGFRLATIAIPEPNTILLLVTGAICLIPIRRRKWNSQCVAIIALFVSSGVPGNAYALTIDMVTVGNPGNALICAITLSSVQRATEPWTMSTRSASTKSRPGSTPSSSTPWPRPTPMGCTTPRWHDYLYGVNIVRSGSSPNFSYSVGPNWAERPVNYVGFWDAARFANWLHNGQPTGPQGPGTTEGGAYHDVGSQTLFGRNAGAKFFIPTEDEWYKAAYHDKAAGPAASYFDYPTGTNSAPGSDTTESTNPGNNANFNYEVYTGPPWQTEVGEFQLSHSPYGTFDQGGNVSEYSESYYYYSVDDVNYAFPVVRGGSSNSTAFSLAARPAAASRILRAAGAPWGFRVASSVPEPSTILLFAFGESARFYATTIRKCVVPWPSTGRLLYRRPANRPRRRDRHRPDRQSRQRAGSTIAGHVRAPRSTAFLLYRRRHCCARSPDPAPL